MLIIPTLDVAPLFTTRKTLREKQMDPIQHVVSFNLNTFKIRDGKDRHMIEIERSFDHFFVIDCDSSISLKDRRAIEIENFMIENQASRCAIYESAKKVTTFLRRKTRVFKTKWLLLPR